MEENRRTKHSNICRQFYLEGCPAQTIPARVAVDSPFFSPVSFRNRALFFGEPFLSWLARKTQNQPIKNTPSTCLCLPRRCFGGRGRRSV